MLRRREGILLLPEIFLHAENRVDERDVDDEICDPGEEHHARTACSTHHAEVHHTTSPPLCCFLGRPQFYHSPHDLASKRRALLVTKKETRQTPFR